MITEVKAAVNFLAKLMHSSGRISKDCVEQFKNSLETRLHNYYAGHWFPETPNRGSGYRCIRINHILDPILASAAKESGITNLLTCIPNELTLWVDPQDVSYRIGENGSIGQLHIPDTPSTNTKSDLTQTQSSYLDSSKNRFNVLHSCKEQLREFTSSKHANSMFTTPFAAFVSS